MGFSIFLVVDTINKVFSSIFYCGCIQSIWFSTLLNLLVCNNFSVDSHGFFKYKIMLVAKIVFLPVIFLCIFAGYYSQTK